MKLYIKQKLFAWNDKFTVKDESGQDRYYVEGEFLSFGKKLHVYDMCGREVAFIKQELLRWTPTFSVVCAGCPVAEIKRCFSFLPKYTIDGLDWEIDGDFTAHEYEITQNGLPIVSICKEWMVWGDSYELTISQPQNEIIALAVVLTIDCVTAAAIAASN